MEPPLQNLATRWEPLGYCIYCGSVDALTDEHIVPFGLGGPGVLPASSCRTCATETGRFEQDVLRGPFWALRAHLGLKSRRPNDSPTEQTLVVVRGGQEEAVSLSLNEHPLCLNFLQFAMPGRLSGRSVKGITILGHFLYNFGRPMADVMKDAGADDLKFSQAWKPISFARMIAKIGWSMACAERHHLKLKPNDTVARIIVDEPDQIGDWVGSFTGDLEAVSGTLHEIRIREDRDRNFMLAEVQLFSYTNTPRYGVILGSLR
ncbi:MAG: hypothetical protein IPH83_18995 [Gammaproteobacteria bacterium]|nr:hypothetical protein [Gammaproteobacteria bacterium]